MAAAIAEQEQSVSNERLIAWGDELREVHRRLREALAVARESVEQPAEGQSASEASRDLLLYCRGFCAALAGHHQSEDASLFPHITSARPDLAPVIAKLSQDHSMMDYLISGLEDALEAGASTTEKLRHLDGLEAVMETHFRYEEKQLIDVLNAAGGLGSDKRKLLGPLA
ncbi:hemerythrin domain-containing protein [Arthrobacter pigmenti]